MNAPTEQEIRDAAYAAIREATPVADAWGESVSTFEAILWDTDDLRTSERDRIDELSEPVFNTLRERLEAIIVEELVRHGTQVAAEYPDAPRRKVEVAA